MFLFLSQSFTHITQLRMVKAANKRDGRWIQINIAFTGSIGAFLVIITESDDKHKTPTAL